MFKSHINFNFRPKSILSFFTGEQNNIICPFFFPLDFHSYMKNNNISVCTNISPSVLFFSLCTHCYSSMCWGAWVWWRLLLGYFGCLISFFPVVLYTLSIFLYTFILAEYSILSFPRFYFFSLFFFFKFSFYNFFPSYFVLQLSCLFFYHILSFFLPSHFLSFFFFIWFFVLFFFIISLSLHSSSLLYDIPFLSFRSNCFFFFFHFILSLLFFPCSYQSPYLFIFPHSIPFFSTFSTLVRSNFIP